MDRAKSPGATKLKITGDSFDPADGLRIRLAMTYFASDQTVSDRFGYLLIMHRHPNCPDFRMIVEASRSEFASLERMLVADLVRFLRTGKLRARGVIAGQLRWLPREWWTDVEVDLEGNTVTAHGVVVSGVLIFEGGHSPAIATAAPEIPPSAVRTGVAGRPTSKHLAIAQMRARAARDELAPSLAGEARYLATEFLPTQHPDSPPMTLKGLEGGIRDEYRKLKSRT